MAAENVPTTGRTAPASYKQKAAAEGFTRNEKGQDVRHQNIVAAKTVADAIRTSLGPRGMDKMIEGSKDSLLITNDGATILKEMSVRHPAARMLVELSKAQDIEAGDGTTSVVVFAGTLLEASRRLLDRGIHSQRIAEAFNMAAEKADDILKAMSTPVCLTNKEELTKAATTALSSKVVSSNSSLLAPMAVDAVLKVIDPEVATTVDLDDIRVVKMLGGTIEDTELIEGLVFTQQKVSRAAGGPRKIQNAKIGLIQFCLSPPKTDLENNITIKDYQAMDRLLREERLIIANMLKKIAKTGCNVLLIQKSILRDAVTDLSLDYAAKLGILIVRDIERDDVDFICRTLHCDPIASLDHFAAERLGSATLVEDQQQLGQGRMTRITGVPGKKTLTILCRASNALVLDETERSLHDALCVVRSLVKTRSLLPGGGAPEMQLAVKLYDFAKNELAGVDELAVKAFAEALEVIPYTLAENAGLKPVQTVTQLRAKHQQGCSTFGIDVKKGSVGDMVAQNVVQPLLVTQSMVKLAAETVMAILKIDDVVLTR